LELTGAPLKKTNRGEEEIGGKVSLDEWLTAA
jgi:hypothetical protein